MTLHRHVTNPEPSVAQDLRVSVKATAIIAVVSGMIGYLFGGGLANAEKFDLEKPACWIIEIEPTRASGSRYC